MLRYDEKTNRCYTLDQYVGTSPFKENLTKEWNLLPEVFFYDSKVDTLEHIKKVSELMGQAACELIRRGNIHDASKLEEPEKGLFDLMTPILDRLEYNSPEYKESLSKLKVALNHHYANNSHHPQHYENGIDGMDLFDLIEMFFDWKAATERTKNGDLTKSIEINAKRFNMSDQLVNIFKNTNKK